MYEKRTAKGSGLGRNYIPQAKNDDYRRAINAFYGRPGLATREQVKEWLERYGSSEDDNLMFDLQQQKEREGE